MSFTVTALEPLPDLDEGSDLPALLTEAAPGFEAGDVLVVAHKAVSKAEGRVRRLSEIEPDARAREIATDQDKDPRLVQAVLDESAEVLRAEHGVLVSVTHHGFVCANAGVDRSNSGHDDLLILLPRDPDGSARVLREALPARPAVVITDSFGRAWRNGQTDVAIGVAGLTPLDDWRGRTDRSGREMHATEIAVADSIAAAADLARTKDSGRPGVLVRGLARFVTSEHGPGAAALRRPADKDMFR